MGLTTNIVRGANAERLLFLMHGLRSDERDLAQLAPHLDPDGRFLAVMPRAPYAVEPGYAWFYMDRPDLLENMSRSSMDAADESLDEACARYGLTREEAIIGGFSQGAAMALAMAYRRSSRPRPAGVLCFSGFALPFEDDLTGTLPPILIQHGTSDDLVPIEAGREAAEWLKGSNVPVTLREYPMGHQISMESIRDAAAWITSVVDGTQAPAEVAPAPAGGIRTLRPQDLPAVVGASTPTIVEFWSQQSGRPMAPVVEQVVVMRKGRYDGASFNVDLSPSVANELRIPQMPAVAMFRNGRMERLSVGVKTRAQLEAELGMLVIP